jgi:hypothetical protein
MPQRNLQIFIISILIFCSLTGCQSIQSRINRYPEEFAKLTPEQQQQVQSGIIEPGYTKSMVRFSQGDPDEVQSERVGTITLERWVYKKPRLVPQPGHSTGFHGAYTAPEFGKEPARPAAMFYSSSSLVIEFQNDVVKRVSQP